MRRRRTNRISVATLHHSLRFPHRETIRVVRSVLRSERRTGWTVNVVFVGDAAMRRIHRRYFGSGTTTDVMSFQYGPGMYPEGEVVVCFDQARRQAPAFGSGFREEVARLLVHGTLHLVGYDDRSKDQRSRMKRREDHLVRQLYARTTR